MTPEGDNATPTQPPLKRPPTGLGAQSAPASAGAGSARPNAGDPWFLRREVILVLALSLGASGVSAFISFVGSLTAPKSLSNQTASLISDAAPGREWLGLAWEVFGLATDLVPVALVAYLLAVRGGSLKTTIGFSRPNRLDLLRGAGIAAVIGGAGLVFYLGSRAAGVNLTVVPSTLPGVWWRFPALIASAIKDGVLEETVVLGYFTNSLDKLGWRPWRADAASSLVRGSYHLYQGLGGFASNAIMGVIFCRLYRRWGRVTPMVVAHSIIDSVAFVGSVLLAGHVSWLPR
jgi:membrane protease YdiL (CAAX protease family)